ncbi:MAG TPA: hypothetical protein VJA21_00095 [Verrucomicrobiae bacterium]
MSEARLPRRNFRAKAGAPPRGTRCRCFIPLSSVSEVALEAGNSPQMIFEHYRELVTEKAGKAWFAITPESTKALREKAEAERKAKIVAFPAKAAAVA